MKNIYGYAIITVFLAAIILVSKVPFKYIIKGMRGILILMLVSVVFNLFLTPGHVVVAIGKLHITSGRHNTFRENGCTSYIPYHWLIDNDIDDNT